jgi:hypothetical protein
MQITINEISIPFIVAITLVVAIIIDGILLTLLYIYYKSDFKFKRLVEVIIWMIKNWEKIKRYI